METVALTSLRWTALFLCFLGLTCAEEEVIQVNVTVGENAILPCKAPNNNNSITVVDWTRPDLDPECVFLYRNNKINANSQNPAFKDRVDLQDKVMKNGDVRLILKNVTINDTGTYKCRVIQTTTNRRKRDVDPISIITLRVVAPPGPSGGLREGGGKEEGGSLGLKVGLSVTAVILVAGVFVLIYTKQKQKQSNGSYQPPDEL